LNNEGEDVVEEPEKESNKNRNDNHNYGEGDGLFASRPRDVCKLAFGIPNIINESIHMFGIKKRPVAYFSYYYNL